MRSSSKHLLYCHGALKVQSKYLLEVIQNATNRYEMMTD